MAANSAIPWTDHTLNPWHGCTMTSPGCTNCYAEEFDARCLRSESRHWGPRAPRRFASDAYMRQPLTWNRAAEKAQERRRVFCMSMGDLFELHEDPVIAGRQGSYRAQVFELIAETPWLDWLLLTKRPENVQGMVPWLGRFPLNVWLGVSIENQEMAGQRLPVLVDLDAQYSGVRPFLSCEPLLGPIDLVAAAPSAMLPLILHWVIAGAESGRRARPYALDWFRALRDQCTGMGVPFFLKQFFERGADGRKRKVEMPELDGRSWAEVPAPLSGQLSPRCAR